MLSNLITTDSATLIPPNSCSFLIFPGIYGARILQLAFSSHKSKWTYSTYVQNKIMWQKPAAAPDWLRLFFCRPCFVTKIATTRLTTHLHADGDLYSEMNQISLKLNSQKILMMNTSGKKNRSWLLLIRSLESRKSYGAEFGSNFGCDYGHLKFITYRGVKAMFDSIKIVHT